MFGCSIWCFMVPAGKIWLGVAVLLVACSKTPAGAPPTGSALEKTQLTIGVAVPAATYQTLYVAVDEGTFAKQGLEADVVEFRGGSDLIRAVVSTSVDVGVVSLAEITAGIDAGQPLTAFYGGFTIPEFDWYGASSIKSLAGAKGKRIGITQYGSSTDFITRYALRVNGLDPSKDVQIIQAGPPATRLAAMQAGQLDIAIFSTPEKFLAAEHGYKLIYSQKQLSDDYPQHLFFATESFLASHPNTVKALLRGRSLQCKPGCRARNVRHDRGAERLREKQSAADDRRSGAAGERMCAGQRKAGVGSGARSSGRVSGFCADAVAHCP